MTHSGPKTPHPDTLAVHAGQSPDPATGARAVPIHLTTSFVFESSDHAAALFNLERPGHVYSRISNPTNAVLEQRVAAQCFTVLGAETLEVLPPFACRRAASEAGIDFF